MQCPLLTFPDVTRSSIFVCLSTSEMHETLLCFLAYCRLAQRKKSGVKDIRHHLVTETFSINRTRAALLSSIHTHLRDICSDERESDHITRPLCIPLLDCNGKRRQKEMMDRWMEGSSDGWTDGGGETSLHI